MAKKKSPYIGYTLEQVQEMENNFFVLQFGGDFVIQDGFYIFTKNEISKIYNNTLKDLTGVIEDGCEKDRKYALDLILGLAIKPMRLH